MVGSANGRSMIASTARLSGKSSRTSTQAISNPKTALTTVTITEMVSVTRNDASADGVVTADQNASQPPSAEVHTIAASGSSTISDSHSTATPICKDPRSRRPGNRRPRLPAGCAAGSGSTSRHPVAFL